MNLTFIKTAVCKAGFVLRKFSPQILTGLGIVSIGAGTVLACRATTKVNDVLDETKSELNAINLATERHQYDEAEDQRKKDLIKTYYNAAYGLVKLYALPTVLLVGGISSILGGHVILNRRNAALLGAYTTISEAYDDYRKRVIKEMGEQKDREFAHNTGNKIVSSQMVEDEDGKKHRKNEYMEVLEDKTNVSGYARLFDEACPEWEPSPDYNLTFLKVNEQHFNDLLRVRGHVFLNEVYDALGFKRTKAGAVVGWICTRNHPSHIDFGMYDMDDEDKVRFLNGDKYEILLDFNVDGVIYDKI